MAKPALKPRLSDSFPDKEYPHLFSTMPRPLRRALRQRQRRDSLALNVSIVCAEEYVDLEEIDDGIWNVHFGAA